MATKTHENPLKNKIKTKHQINENKLHIKEEKQKQEEKRAKLEKVRQNDLNEITNTLEDTLKIIETNYKNHEIEENLYFELKEKIEKELKINSRIINTTKIDLKTLNKTPEKLKETLELHEKIQNEIIKRKLKNIFNNMKKDYDYFEENLEFYIDVYDEKDNNTEIVKQLTEKAKTCINNLEEIFENQYISPETYEKFKFLLKKSIKQIETNNKPSEFNNKILKHLKIVYKKAFIKISEKF